MLLHRHRLMNEAGDASTAGVAGDPAAAPAAAPAADPSAAPAAAPAPAAPASLMARGATAETPPAEGQGEQPSIPEKYLVKREDGSTDWEASALKQAQGYGELAKRLGSGDAPPKTPEEYAPDLPEGVTMDALKSDPLFAGFLKGAHAKGLNNAQVSYILGEFQQRMQLMQEQARDPAVAEAELSKVWTTPAAMEKGLGNSYRAAKAFADGDEHFAKLEQKFGSDPDFIRLMAKIGAELGEDRPPAGLSPVEAETLETLKAHPAYGDAKHAEHQAVVAKVSALYRKLYPD